MALRAVTIVFSSYAKWASRSDSQAFEVVPEAGGVALAGDVAVSELLDLFL